MTTDVSVFHHQISLPFISGFHFKLTSFVVKGIQLCNKNETLPLKKRSSSGSRWISWYPSAG